MWVFGMDPIPVIVKSRECKRHELHELSKLFTYDPKYYHREANYSNEQL